MRLLTMFFIVATFCLMVVSSGQAAPIEGLVLYLPFNEGTGDLASDLSGKGNDGTLMGDPKWVPGKDGTGLQFSGEENKNHVEIPDDPTLNPTKELTCAAWIFFEEFHPSAGIISKYIGAGNQRTYDLHMNHNLSLALMTNCSSNGAYQLGVSTTMAETPADTLKEGEWNHVAMTFTAKRSLNLYVDGELKGEADAAATDSLFDNTVPLLIGTDFEIGGKHGGQNPREFTGIIDEVAIFDRALSADEIKSVMNGLILSVESYGKLTSTWGAIKKP